MSNLLTTLIYALSAHALANFFLGVYAKVKAALTSAAPAVGNALPADPSKAITSVEDLIGSLLSKGFAWVMGLFKKSA